jgi:hypothetical protein
MIKTAGRIKSSIWKNKDWKIKSNEKDVPVFNKSDMVKSNL